MSGPAGGSIGKRHEVGEDSKIVLRIIDRGRRVGRCRPSESGGRCRLGAARKLGKIRKPAFG
jgi:hypothetical protein